MGKGGGMPTYYSGCRRLVKKMPKGLRSQIEVVKVKDKDRCECHLGNVVALIVSLVISRWSLGSYLPTAWDDGGRHRELCRFELSCGFF
jgi:hypothetical protein